MGRKGTQTRERLIRATVELLEKRSIRDMSVSDIATLAGTSSSSFYIYFSDVTAAALAAAESVEQITPEIEAILGKPWTRAAAQANAIAFLEGYVNFSSKHHAILRVRKPLPPMKAMCASASRRHDIARSHESTICWNRGSRPSTTAWIRLRALQPYSRSWSASLPLPACAAAATIPLA